MPLVGVVAIRSFIAFFVLLLLARLMGKTQISQLSFFDYIVGITVGSIAAVLSVDTTIQAVSCTVGLLVWAGLAVAMDSLVLKSIPARKLIEGEPTIIIRSGKLMEEAMARAHYSVSELMTQLRQHQVFDLSQVQEAVLETNGKLSVLTKPAESAPTRKDLNINTASMEGEPVIMVVDGNIAHHRLKEKNLDENWLMVQLKAQGVNRVDDVMVAQLGSSGQLYVDTRADWEANKNVSPG